MIRASTLTLTAIFILSAAALGYEVLLVRMFAVIHWHHFAFMVISIALLGYGASGSFIAVLQRQFLAFYDYVFIINILLFGISSIACVVIVQYLPFNALEILWDSKQWLRLLTSYLLLSLPFFFASNAIALSMMRYSAQLPLIYGVDLAGAATGAIMLMFMLQFMLPDVVLRLLSISGLLAVLLAIHNIGYRQKLIVISLVVTMICLVIVLPDQLVELRLSPYKGLEQSLLVKGVKRLHQDSDTLSRVDVLQSDEIPFRHAPGMSLNSPSGPPQQLAVFMDGDEMTAIDHVVSEESLIYLDYMSSALPYHVKDSARSVLLLGAAGGGELHLAASRASERVDAVEADTKLDSLVTGRFAGYSGWQNISDRVRFHNITARGYLASNRTRYDIVILAVPGASSGAAAGVHALAASYSMTVEALTAYLDSLETDGLLSITLWTSTPPRSNLRLFATAVEALKNTGIERPGESMAWIRSWNTATLLIKKGRLTGQDTENIRFFSTQRAYDLAWLPDIERSEVNRYQLLQQPIYYMAAKALLSESAGNFIRDYKYSIGAVFDDNPYFNNYFKWSGLTELLTMPGRAGIALIDVGYPALLATLLQAIIAASVLILLPLLLIKISNHGMHWRVFIYFLNIGLAFLLIEIAFIQKFTLILSQPLYAFAVTLCAFLLFSGMGSLYIQKRVSVTGNKGIPALLQRSVIAICSITIVYLMLLPQLGNFIMSMAETIRIIFAFILAAPLAFFMGMPLPLGLMLARKTDSRLVPWAWGINGCASVLSAVLAILLAMETGFSGVMLCAAILYLFAWLSYR